CNPRELPSFPPRRSSDLRRVGVDEDDTQALLAQHPAGLGARVVELGGLPDDDRAGPDDEDAGDVGAAGHQWLVLSVMRAAKRSQRCAATGGPAAGPRWDWPEHA